jgi:hypothetical protein
VIEAYPLYWPEGSPRKDRFRRENARFETSFARARDEIIRQIELLCGRYPKPNIIISTNLALRRDGLPLALSKQPDDPGVAVYFDYKNKQVCFACDRWNKIEHNMQAVCKTIDALRGIDRWGTGDMIEAAFKGFVALPSPSAMRNWREILGFTAAESRIGVVEGAYKRLRSESHPDNGGTPERFHAVQKAWEQAQQELQP